MKDIKVDKETYICIHGRCDKKTGLMGNYCHIFVKVTNEQVSTGREFLEVFESKEKMKNNFKNKEKEIEEQLNFNEVRGGISLYKSIDQLPEQTKNLPMKAKEIWMATYNSTFSKTPDEKESQKVAWGAIGNAGFKKGNDGNWMKMCEEYSHYYSVSLSEAKKEIEIMRVGSWKHPHYGNIVIKKADLEGFVKSFDDHVRGVDLAIDLEHGETSQKGASAGWFKSLRVDNKRLLASIEWTELGTESIKSGKYKYFSPEFRFSYKDAESGKIYKNVLLGGGLTNRPFIKNMSPVLLSENITDEILGSCLFEELNEEENNNNNRKDVLTMNKELLKVLKLDENCSQEDYDKALNAYIKKLSESSTNLTSKVKKLDEEIIKRDEDNKKLDEKVKALLGEKTDEEKKNLKLTERLEKVEKKLDDSEWEAIETKCFSEGKFTKPLAEKYKKLFFSDKEMCLDIIGSLQPVIDLAEKGSSKGNDSEKDDCMKLFENAVDKLMLADKDLSYTDALVLAEQNDPALFEKVERERG